MEIINKAKKQYKNVDRSFYNEIRANLLLGFALFDDGFDNMEYMKYAYLQFYKLIEYISDNEIFLNESDDSHILVKNKNKHITVKRDNVSALFYHEKDRMYKVGEAKYTRRVDTNYKVSALLIFRFGFDTSANWSWININYNRNQKAAHNSNEEMSLNDIIEILRFISKILNDENISSKHADKGIS